MSLLPEGSIWFHQSCCISLASKSCLQGSLGFIDLTINILPPCVCVHGYLTKLVRTLQLEGFSKSSESSYTPNLTERTKHTGGDVGVSPDTLTTARQVFVRAAHRAGRGTELEYRECPAEIGTVGNHAIPSTDCFDYHNDIHRLCNRIILDIVVMSYEFPVHTRPDTAAIL